MMQQTAPEFGTGRIDCLDGVRATSILLVVLAHTAPLGPKPWLFNSMAASMGMALFFCLSGYLITSMLYRKPEVLPFLAKRITRIVPALFIYLTVLWLFFGLPAQSWLLNMAFLSNYLTIGLAGGPVGHLWSLCVEIHFYLAISLAVALAGRQAVWLVFPAALVITGFRIEAEAYANINTHLRVDEILVGGWLALISAHHGGRLRRWLAHPGVAAAVIAALSLLFMVASHEEGGALIYVRAYVAMCLVGAIMHSRVPVLTPVLESAPARYIARISYAVYIWHMLMVWGWMNAGSTAERYLLKRPVSWTLTWIVSHLSTEYWERYWQRAIRRWLEARDRRAGQRQAAE